MGEKIDVSGMLGPGDLEYDDKGFVIEAEGDCDIKKRIRELEEQNGIDEFAINAAQRAIRELRNSIQFRYETIERLCKECIELNER